METIGIIFVVLICFFVGMLVINEVLDSYGLKHFRNIKKNKIDTSFGEWYCKYKNIPNLQQLKSIEEQIAKDMENEYLEVEHRIKLDKVKNAIMSIRLNLYNTGSISTYYNNTTIYLKVMTIGTYIKRIENVEYGLGYKLRGKK